MRKERKLGHGCSALWSELVPLFWCLVWYHKNGFRDNSRGLQTILTQWKIWSTPLTYYSCWTLTVIVLSLRPAQISTSCKGLFEEEQNRAMCRDLGPDRLVLGPALLLLGVAAWTSDSCFAKLGF